MAKRVIIGDEGQNMCLRIQIAILSITDTY